MENFSKTGEAVEYYVLLDISGSITGERFTDIKTALTQFRSELRENDSLILLTFGNEVTQVLGGTEDQQSAAAVINCRSTPVSYTHHRDFRWEKTVPMIQEMQKAQKTR